jgi:class 3 adenylate cyclase
VTDEREWEAAGLYDPDAPDAADRGALLEYLTKLGMSVDDIAQAARRGRLDRVAADHVLWHDAGPTLSARDIAERTGIDEADVRAVLRAAGEVVSSDAPVYGESYADLFAGYVVGVEIFGYDAVLQFMRVLGSTAQRVAEAAVALFVQEVSPRLDATSANELERVRQSAEAVQAFQVVPPIMDVLLREHFLTAVRRLGLIDFGEGGATAVTIAFVDLVASTRLAHQLAPAQLSAAFGGFERAAMDGATAHDCRVVKLIGDEVMIAGVETANVLAVVRDVLAFVEDHPALSGARTGIAAGRAVSRDGDYFGPLVNLAARLVDTAEPGEVLVNDDAATVASAQGYSVDEGVGRILKGFDRPVAVTRLHLR